MMTPVRIMPARSGTPALPSECQRKGVQRKEGTMTQATRSAATILTPAEETKAAAVKDFRHAAAGVAGLPPPKGLYSRGNEGGACGGGFIAQLKGVGSHGIVVDGLAMLESLAGRGAVGADGLVGDGAGVLVQVPDRFFRE